MTKISAAECYSNQDVITQIYGMMSTIDTSTYKSVNVAREGNSIVFTFTTNDDVAHTFTISDPGIADITSSISGSQVTINFIMTDGSIKSVTYTATGGVTLDTEQTLTAKKVMAAGLDVTGGTLKAVTGEVTDLTSRNVKATVSADLQNATVAGGLNVFGDTEVEKLTVKGALTAADVQATGAVVGADIATTTGISLSEMSGKAAKTSLANGDVKQVGTSASPGTGVTAQTVKATVSADLQTASVGTLTATGLITANGGVDATVIAASTMAAGTVTANTINATNVRATGSVKVPTVDKADGSTSAASTAFVVAMTGDTGGTVNNLLHTNGDESYTGMKRGVIPQMAYGRLDANAAYAVLSLGSSASVHYCGFILSSRYKTCILHIPSGRRYSVIGDFTGWSVGTVEDDGSLLLVLKQTQSSVNFALSELFHQTSTSTGRQESTVITPYVVTNESAITWFTEG